MNRTTLIGFRVEPSVKQAAERAAAADHRTLSSLMEKVLLEFLRERGYITPASDRGIDQRSRRSQ